MKWSSWTSRGARERPDSFTPIVAVSEMPSLIQQVTEAPEPARTSSFSRRRGVSKPQHYAANSSMESTVSTTTVGAESGSPLTARRVTSQSWSYRHSQTMGVPQRTWGSEWSRARSKASVRPLGELRRSSVVSSLASPRASGLGLRPFAPPNAAGWGGRMASCRTPPGTSRVMSMDTFFDDMVAEMRRDAAKSPSCSGPHQPESQCDLDLTKFSSAQRGSPSWWSGPHQPESECGLDLTKFSSLTGSPADASESSHLQASTQELGDAKRPMTLAEICAWKAKNGAPPSPLSRAESPERGGI